MTSDITLRVATPDDAPELLRIYAYYVEHTAITYEYDVPALSDFRSRIAHTLERYPYLVAVCDEKIIGYAYAGALHARAAYGWNAEMTVYLDHEAHHHGVGTLLYHTLENILKEQGVIQLVALITPPPTEAEQQIYPSIAFHEKMGYQHIGRLPHSGYKFHRWFDTVMMAKTINPPETMMQPVRDFHAVRHLFHL